MGNMNIAVVTGSHRNGEATPPEVAGEYDFFGKRRFCVL
jgi:hypothetical protein